MTHYNKPMSLFIPSVHRNVTKQQVKEAFDKLDIGLVRCVYFITKKNSMFKIAFVHFHMWYTTIISKHFQERVKNPDKVARLVYNDPYYWNCFEYQSVILTEEDYKRIEDFEDSLEEEETWEDYAIANKEGITMQDLIRCENYLDSVVS